MSSEGRESTTARALELLNDRERKAYDYWRASSKPALSPVLNARMFNLWLQGKDTEEIRRLNPSIGLGEIVAARIEGEWDRRRNEHLDKLLTATAERVQQVSLETADFICDLLAVANREHGDRLRRYLQTGDQSELAGSFKIDGIVNLGRAIEMLQNLTGQSRQTVVRHQGSVEVQPVPAAKPVSAVEAGTALKLLLEAQKEST